MGTIVKVIATVTAILAPMASHAQLYKCSDADGRIVYGDRPCPGNMKAQSLRPEKTTPPLQSDSASSADSLDPGVDGSRSRRMRELDTAIADLEDKRDKLVERMRFERSIVDGGKPTVPVNPEGTGWEQTTSDELSVVATRYRADMDAIDEQIRTLRNERRRLQKTR